MVAVGGFNGLRTRLDSSLVAKWPDPIDLASDIFIPGKTAAFKSQLMAALQSRDLWSIIASTDPTAITIAEQNPDATRGEVEDALRQVRGDGSGKICLALVLKTNRISRLPSRRPSMSAL